MHLEFRNRRRILNGPDAAVYNQQASGVYAFLTQKANPKGLLTTFVVVGNVLEHLGGQ